jgi:hypothetical protein
LKRLPLLLALAVAPPTALPTFADEAPRGPAEIRDGQLLAQPRLTLPALSPHPTARGAWAFQVSALWANSFSWTQNVAGEEPKTRHFLIDGEALVLDATLRRGLGKNVDVGLRVPLQSRGGGALDGFIDWWHRAAHVPNGDRPSFLTNAFRVEGVTTDGAPFSWNDHSGSGLGDLELETRWRVRDGGRDSPSVAVVGRVSLPTGTGPFEGNGVGGGGQVVLGSPLGGSFDLYAGAGLTAQDPGPVRGIRYEPVRAHGFLALEWRPWRRLSLVAETNAASRLVDNIRSYPGLHWIVNVTGRLDLGEHARLDLGFTENLKSQLTTTDFALTLGLGIRP